MFAAAASKGRVRDASAAGDRDRVRGRFRDWEKEGVGDRFWLPLLEAIDGCSECDRERARKDRSCLPCDGEDRPEAFPIR